MAKHVSDSEVEQIQIVLGYHLNGQGRVFGGQLAAWIDIVAGAVAQRHCNHNITTAAIDSLQFRKPVYANEIVILHGKLTYVGKTSMEVRVDSFSEDITGIRKLVNTAYVVLVALDENQKPTPVPQLICENFQQKAEWDGGEKRRKLRKERRKEAY